MFDRTGISLRPTISSPDKHKTTGESPANRAGAQNAAPMASPLMRQPEPPAAQFIRTTNPGNMAANQNQQPQPRQAPAQGNPFMGQTPAGLMQTLAAQAVVFFKGNTREVRNNPDDTEEQIDRERYNSEAADDLLGDGKVKESNQSSMGKG